MENKVIKKIGEYLLSNDDVLSLMLGGSRAINTHKEKSDYDFFSVIRSENFDIVRKNFSNYLEVCEDILYVAEFSYIENWGYLFEGIMVQDKITFDISIIPLSRINEMGLSRKNRIIFDKTGEMERYIKKNIILDSRNQELLKRESYVRLFGFEILRIQRSVEKGDYWRAVKSIERMKEYYMRYKRIKSKKYSGNSYKPEKNFDYDFPDDELKGIYRLDGSLHMVKKNAAKITEIFLTMIEDNKILSAFNLVNILLWVEE